MGPLKHFIVHFGSLLQVYRSIPLALALVLSLTSCGSYYTFNGVPLRGEEEQTGVSSGNTNIATMTLKQLQKYCSKNPATCIGLGLGVVVGGVFVVQQRNDKKDDNAPGGLCPPNC